MTPPEVISINTRIYLGRNNELLAKVKYAHAIEEYGYLPLSLLDECAAHLQQEGLARFTITEGFHSHFSYRGKYFYGLIDSAGAYFLFEGTTCGNWSIQLPNGRWLYCPAIASAA